MITLPSLGPQRNEELATRRESESEGDGRRNEGGTDRRDREPISATRLLVIESHLHSPYPPLFTPFLALSSLPAHSLVSLIRLT